MSGKKLRVLYGLIMQETNTFTPINTTFEYFLKTHGLYKGEEIIERFKGSLSEAGGVIDAASKNNVELVPLIWTGAPPLGRILRESLERILNELLQMVEKEAANGFDAVLLSLHGAMAAEGIDDADGYILSRVRRIIGYDVPLGVSFDMHANITERKVSESSIIVGYKTEPHIDMYQTGFRAAELTFQAARGLINPLIKWVKIPMITPAEKHDHRFHPMKTLLENAKKIAEELGILEVSIFPVQPWLDVEELGWSVVAISDGDPEKAAEAARKISSKCWEMRREFMVEKTPISEVIEIIRNTRQGPVVVSDGGDATTGGAPGDSTFVLSNLLGKNLGGEVLLNIVDPWAVEAAWSASINDVVELELGGKLDPFSKPVRVSGRVLWRGDARYIAMGDVGKGLSVNLGRAVVLAVDDLRILISELPGNPFEPDQYRCVGLEPMRAKAVFVKSITGFKANYEPFAKKIIHADTTGATTHRLKSLNYVKAPRPLYPLDEEFSWKPLVKN
ncbi:MAG: M81 family metallopeptidase [Nitrososphaerota archaeon]